MTLEKYPVSDESIITHIKSGSIDYGFRSLVDKYKEKVYWNIRRMVNTHEDADDLVQETFIKVYQNLGKFEGKSGLYTWIYRISVNETLSYLRRSKRDKVIELKNEELYVIGSDDVPDGDQIQKLLKKAVEGLPDRQRMVFNMRYFEEMKYDDMSQILDLSVGALKASYHHAVKKIEQYVMSRNDL